MRKDQLMKLDPQNRRNFDLLIGVMENFRKLDTEMPIQYATSFLQIALNEDQDDGLSVQDLEGLIHLSQSATSRNVQALSKWFKAKVPGHDLVETFENPIDRRKKIVRLNTKGRTLANNLLHFLKRMNEPV
jgi:DNA-binding MarR family transcriptional regulator